MVDALALGASEETHGGSSPLPGTHIKTVRFILAVFICAEPAWGGLEARLRYFDAKREISNWGTESVRLKSSPK